MGTENTITKVADARVPATRGATADAHLTDPLSGLSRRERDVLTLMAAGFSNAGIARTLWLTERTVEAHVSRIMIKLGVDAEGGYNRRVLTVLTYLAEELPDSTVNYA